MEMLKAMLGLVEMWQRHRTNIVVSHNWYINDLQKPRLLIIRVTNNGVRPVTITRIRLIMDGVNLPHRTLPVHHFESHNFPNEQVEDCHDTPLPVRLEQGAMAQGIFSGLEIADWLRLAAKHVDTSGVYLVPGCVDSVGRRHLGSERISYDTWMSYGNPDTVEALLSDSQEFPDEEFPDAWRRGGME